MLKLLEQGSVASWLCLLSREESGERMALQQADLK